MFSAGTVEINAGIMEGRNQVTFQRRALLKELPSAPNGAEQCKGEADVLDIIMAELAHIEDMSECSARSRTKTYLSMLE